MPRSVSRLLLTSLVLLGVSAPLVASEFRSAWPVDASRPWIGPDYWANPLQDWHLRNGLLECHVAGGDRNVFLLTRETGARPGDLDMSVTLGRLAGDTGPLGEGFVGFRVGIRGAFDDYRDSAVRGAGLNAGVAGDGRLFIGALEADAPRVSSLDRRLLLHLRAEPAGDAYRLTLTATHEGGATVTLTREDVPADWLTGGLALVCSSGEVWDTPTAPEMLAGFGERRGTARGGAFRFWFHEWRVAGTKIDDHPERAFGPILFALHTLSRGILKVTAQLAPLDEPTTVVSLEVRETGGDWRSVATAPVDPLARTATFRVADWDDSKDIPYRVFLHHGGESHSWAGTVRRDPKTKPRLTVAAFTGNNDLGFPHADVARNVRHFAPDLLVFTGDNIYERVADYGIERAPLAAATLDYLRKWFLFGWEYRDLLREIPAVCLVDDHDVYQGNIWGAGGRHATEHGKPGQDQGGYTMPAAWVNMVQRTQTSHLPDPPDPTPVEQGIGVYYSDLLYGGLSVAIIEDRKWKSAPAVELPGAKIVNGWAQNPEYDAAQDGDAPDAQLLGPRQEQFLEDWTADWSGGVWMKVVASQTIFANVATLPPPADTDDVTPQLRVMKPGEYAEGEIPVADHDSNGWPQTPRNRALRAMRKGLAVHIAGDQHLGSTIQYGIDDWNDASWAICVPSVANVWPRRWYPSEPGANRAPRAPRYTGEFLDGFGNRMTVHAVSNPVESGAEPRALFDRAPGYGIVTFDRATRRITFANWPRWVDAARPGAAPYPGWPITIDQVDNGLPDTGWALPEVSAPGLVDGVVEVVDESTGERVYTFRIQGESLAPPVPGPGTYSVRVFDPDRPDTTSSFKGLQARQVR
ncbi:MAG: alkaline phosphatase D family protein [Acidobacteria bacterium]|nr:alkaline phosphatase D family protein [Acidobacteriota bacterium]